MGLSNTERAEGIFFCLKDIDEEARTLAQHPSYETEKLRQLLRKLWPAAIGHNNGIVGSSSSDKIHHSASDPWSVVIRTRIQDESKEEDNLVSEDHFNLFDMLEIKTILGLHSIEDRAIFAVYEITENLMRNIHYYKDEFEVSCGRLSDMVARIQGECFALFSKRDAFAIAYLTHQLARLIYKSNYYIHGDSENPNIKIDSFDRILWKHHLHHNIAANGSRTSIKDLTILYKMFMDKDELTRKDVKTRIKVMLLLCGKELHYDWKQEEILKDIAAIPELAEDTAFIEELRAICKKNTLLYEEEEKKWRDREDKNDFYDSLDIINE